MSVVQLRAELTNDEHTALNVLAARLGLTRVQLVTRALHTAPVTRDLFTRKEEETTR